MQELLFKSMASHLDDPFDDYVVTRWKRIGERGVVYLKKTDANGKHWHMVAERVDDGDYAWVLTNAKEFKHAEHKADRYFIRRIGELEDADA